MLTTIRGRRGASENSIVIEIPAELKSLVKPIKAMIEEIRRKVLSARGGRAVDFAATERLVARLNADVEREGCRLALAALEVDKPHVVIGGKTFHRIDHAPGTYFTMVGAVTIKRALYREAGVRSGKAVDAISLRSGVYGRGWLPATAQMMAHLVQQGTAREAEATARQSGRLPYSRVSFDRVTHEIGDHWQRHHADIEDQLIQELQIPEGTSAISVALDRTSVPIEEALPRSPGRPRKDAPKRPIERNFHMAYCGTVTLHDAKGKSLYTIRYACMPDSDPELLVGGMANDVFHLMQREPGLRFQQLADGAHEIWGLFAAHFPTTVFGECLQLIDFYHLVEKLAPAATTLFGEKRAKENVARWVLMLRRRNSAAAEIRDELLESGKQNARRDGKRPVHDAITYIENHEARMHYASARRRHLPIGSGNVEATCKTLVGLRMKRAGSRWKSPTGEHILKLRALALSDRWDDAIDQLHAARRTAVRKAA